jgi:membrane dipeptidase
MMIIDAHLDLAYNVTRGRDVRMPAARQPIADNEIATVGFPDLKAGGVDLIFATIFCSPKTYKQTGYTNPQEAYEQAIAQLDQYDHWEREGWIKIVRSGEWGVGKKDKLPTPHSPLQTHILLEGAEAIRDVADVQTFYDRGVRIVGLSWQKTRYAGGTATPGPLTESGRELVRAFDQIGIIHDASHLAERSFWDLTHATDRTIIASHSNCRAIVGRDPNERHLTDAMIRQIADRDGVVGINFYDKFLLPFTDTGKRRATLADVVAHIKHICDLTGSANHVAIGTDMDGGLGRDQIPQEIITAADLPKVGEALLVAGFSASDVEKINSGNWLRVLRQARWSD